MPAAPASSTNVAVSSCCQIEVDSFVRDVFRSSGRAIGKLMELSGANYLYALATISVTFVGFSALLLVFRETIGGKMTRYDSYFTLSFMQAGFIVIAGGLLPHLLAFYGMSETSVWRAASAIMVIPILLFVANTPRRRRAATKQPAPFYVRLL